MVYEKGREVVAETGEVVEDIVAEVKAEMTEEQKVATSASAPEGEGTKI